MPIQENAINAALAAVLSGYGVHATPENTNITSGLKRCDIRIRDQHDSLYFTAVECKIGQDTAKKNQAVKDAQRWLNQPDCCNAIALCYSEEISQDDRTTTQQQLEESVNLMMAKVNPDGVVGQWHTGEVSDLVKLAKDVGANDTGAITDILKNAIITASENIDAQTGKDLAETMGLPWDPQKSNIDHRPARIACLILANMALLQNQMHSQGVRIPQLEPLTAARAAANKQTALLDNWNRIRKVDYAPVVDPALLILHKLPANSATDTLLGILIEAVFKCAPRIRGFQLDHAGPLYHELLQTARYDGSFYTSTVAAVLLSELAMPPDWREDWSDISKLAALKVCDPACGTGTLLMASARTIEERFRSATNNKEDLPLLHLSLIEDVLHGLDINRHAIHLAASMLTLSAPKIDYNKMNLYNMQHGETDNKEVRAGSLDLLANNAKCRPLPELALDTTQQRATASGYRSETLDLEGRHDLVIMNPPFTRNDIRNRGLPTEVREKVKKHEIEIAGNAACEEHRKAIRQSTVFTFFAPIADLLLKKQSGTVAIVQPFAACTGPDASGHRSILTDPSRFHVEMVVTSHDNRRIYFSENTKIHESLVVARRPTSKMKDARTAFISLGDNPASVSEAHFLAEAIQKALNGDTTSLAEYGTIAWRSLEHSGRAWNAACFYDQGLASVCDELPNNPGLATLGEVANVEPEGRRIRAAFKKAKLRQSPDMRALWDHKTKRQNAMRTKPDSFLVAKKNQQDYALSLWQRRSHLLLANRMRLNLTQTPAVFADEPILGSSFVPVLPAENDRMRLCKAWCVWFNSTLGVISFLNVRQKNLTYPSFSLDALRSLPVPHPDHCDISALEQAFEQHADTPLQPLPGIDTDPVRQALDDAVSRAIPELSKGMDGGIADLRRAVALEPTVNNEKTPLALNAPANTRV